MACSVPAMLHQERHTPVQTAEHDADEGSQTYSLQLHEQQRCWPAEPLQVLDPQAQALVKAVLVEHAERELTPLAVQLTLEPYMLCSSAGEITGYQHGEKRAHERGRCPDIGAGARFGAHHLPCRVNRPPPRTTPSMAAIGRRFVRPLHREETAEITEARGCTAKESGSRRASRISRSARFTMFPVRMLLLARKML